MRIAVVGSQNVGKTTLIKDMLNRWTMYSTPDVTYRNLITDNKMPCNRETTVETQQTLMNFISDQVIAGKPDDMTIHDRSPYCALVYSLYKHLKGDETFDDDFIKNQILIAREASKFLDIIFYVPIIEKYDIPIVDDKLRDTDPEYRKEIDNIYAGIFSTDEYGMSPFFYPDDRPAVIEIFGTPEERIKMIEFYISESGKPFGEEDSLISDDIYVPEEFRVGGGIGETSDNSESN